MHASSRTLPQLWICMLGQVPYGKATALQQGLRALRQAGELPDVILLLEHPPTYTRGRRSAPEELPHGDAFYRARGIDVFDTDRGGRVTYHGPGQLVGYPILRARDVVAHVRRMETAVVLALADEGIASRSRASDGPDFTGVWVEDRKIASIGVHHSRGVTTHGFAVNVENDLQPFEWIVPCGLAGVRMTSIAEEHRRAAASGTGAASGHTDRADEDARRPMTRFADRLVEHYCALLERKPRLVAPRELARVAPQGRSRRSPVAA